MKFKVSNGEMLALIEILLGSIELYNKAIEKHPYPDLETCLNMKLYNSILALIALDLQRKALIKKKKYSLKFPPHQAIAFWLVYSGKVSEKNHEGIMIQTMCNAIHQQIICK